MNTPQRRAVRRRTRAVRYLAVLACVGAACTESTAPPQDHTTPPPVPGRVAAFATVGTTLYAGGEDVSAAGAPKGFVATWDGSKWNLLPGLDAPVDALAEFEGTLVAGGEFTTAGGTAASHVARWTGTAWEPLGAGANGPVRAFAVQAGVLLYAGGNFTQAGAVPAYSTARFVAGQWTGLGEGLAGDVRSLVFLGGSLIAGGDFSLRETSEYERNLARWNGSNWSCIAPGIDGTVYAMVVSQGELTVGGDFRQADWVTPARHVARLVGTGENWRNVGVGFGPGDSLDVAGVRTLHVDGDAIIAGGIFQMADLQSADCVARYADGQWSPVGLGLNASVDAVIAFDGKTFAGGRFTASGASTVHYVGYFDGSGWH